jgi:hypothetical protein
VAVDQWGQHFYAPEELLEKRGEAATYLVTMGLGIPGFACAAIGVVSDIGWLAALGGTFFAPLALFGNVQINRVLRRQHGGQPWALREMRRRAEIGSAMWSPRLLLYAWRKVGRTSA